MSAWHWLAAGACAAAVVACGGGSDVMPASTFTVRSLVSDGTGTPHTDSHLVNGWGIAFNPQAFVWVANNETSTSTLYDGNGVPQSLVVEIPAGAAGEAHPTGIVYNGSNDFAVTGPSGTGPARFVFAGEAGTIAAWSPAADATHAITVHDGAASGASYKGLAIAAQNGAGRLYAADFHNRRIDVFDAAFNPVAAAGFDDPSLPADYAPFGIQAIGDRIVVAYAKRDASGDEEEPGPGLGIVDVFDTGGTLIRRLVTGGELNAPWGIAMAPAAYGPFGNALLIGNFGDGKIHAYDPTSGELRGTLRSADGSEIEIEGLWGIAFGNGMNDQPTGTLFFAAGPDDEAHGLYGRIDPN